MDVSKNTIILMLALFLASSVYAIEWPAESLNPYYFNLSKFINTTISTLDGKLWAGLNSSFFNLNITGNLSVIGLINASSSTLIDNGTINKSIDLGNYATLIDVGLLLRNHTDANFSNINVTTLQGKAISLYNLSVSLDNYPQFSNPFFDTANNLTGNAFFNSFTNKGNLTIWYPNIDLNTLDDYNIANNASNNTIKIGDNITSAPWNTSATAIFQRDLGKNVGIGTTSPITPLDINTSTATPLSLFRSGLSANTGRWTFLIDTNNLYLKPRNDDGTVLVDALTIAHATGNIGINDTTPSYTLDVTGTARVVTAGGTEALFVNPTGKVGIGTTTPGSLLHLSSATAEQRFNDTDNPNWWQVGAVGDDFKIALNDSTTDVLYIDQDGNIVVVEPNKLCLNTNCSTYLCKNQSGISMWINEKSDEVCL